jgi:hypothetical protein
MSPDFERLVGRVVLDKAFRAKLLANFDETIKESGLKLTDEETKELRKNTEQFKVEAASQVIDQQVGTLRAW